MCGSGDSCDGCISGGGIFIRPLSCHPGQEAHVALTTRGSGHILQTLSDTRTWRIFMNNHCKMTRIHDFGGFELIDAKK